MLGVDPVGPGHAPRAGAHPRRPAHLRDRGLGEVLLYVEADNAPAIRVYADLGFVHTDTDVSYAGESQRVNPLATPGGWDEGHSRWSPRDHGGPSEWCVTPFRERVHATFT